MNKPDQSRRSERKKVMLAFRGSAALHRELSELAEALGLDLAGLLRQMVHCARPEFERRRDEIRHGQQLNLTAAPDLLVAANKAVVVIRKVLQGGNRQAMDTQMVNTIEALRDAIGKATDTEPDSIGKEAHS